VFPKENIGTSIGGTNKSPELDWTAGPSGTQSYAIVLQDLTNITGGKPFVHWAMWNIPGATRMLPAGLETTAMPSVPAGSSQKSFQGNGYQGSGKCGNVYEFVLYALTTATYAGSTSSQTAVRDGLVATNAPTATLRAKSGAPGCTP
jgi:Raf kinase inhibitor-like YbhB/YbcL family protein